jgi:hypothetical protein
MLRRCALVVLGLALTVPARTARAENSCGGVKFLMCTEWTLLLSGQNVFGLGQAGFEGKSNGAANQLKALSPGSITASWLSIASEENGASGFAHELHSNGSLHAPPGLLHLLFATSTLPGLHFGQSGGQNAGANGAQNGGQAAGAGAGNAPSNLGAAGSQSGGAQGSENSGGQSGQSANQVGQGSAAPLAVINNPEPATLALIGTGLGALLLRRRRRQAHS